MRPWLAFSLVFLLGGCGPSAFVGDVLITVTFSRPAPGPDCVTFTATDVIARTSGVDRHEQRTISLTDLAESGALKVALQQPAGWSARIAMQATLNAGACDGPVIATSETWETSFEKSISKTHTLALAVTGTDAGVDAGGFDAGFADAGPVDAGARDAGALDAGTTDAGVDAGFDAGTFDAGPPFDAGQPVDAGAPCTEAVRQLTGAAANGDQWKDLALYNPAVGQVMAVGDNDALSLVNVDGSLTAWGGGQCTGNFRAAWLRPSTGLVYVASTQHLYLVKGAQQCDPVATFNNGSVTSLTGFDLPDGGLRLFVGASASPFLSEVVADGGLVASAVSAPGPVYDLATYDPGSTFAVGTESNRQVIWRYDVASSSWLRTATGNNGTLLAVDVVAPAEAFAAGWLGANLFTYSWNGLVWVPTAATPDFKVRGLAMRSRSHVIAVGDQRSNAVGFAVFNGATWSYPTGPTNTEVLRRVRSAGGCDVWAVGDNGFVVTTRP